MLRSLQNLQRVDVGVRIDNILALSTDLPAASYPM